MFLQTIILSAINYMLSSKLNVLFHDSIPSVQNWKNSFTSRGCVFQTIILGTNNPMLSSQLNVLSHNSVPSGQICKIHSQAGCSFFQDSCFEYIQLHVIFKIEHFVPYLCSVLSDLNNSFTNKGCLGKYFAYQEPYVIFKIEHFVP